MRDQFYLGGGTGNTIVRDILRAAGEIGLPTLPVRVASWLRSEGTAGQALDQIVATLDALWWVDRDGTVRASARRPSNTVDLTKWTRVGSDVDGSISYVGDSAAGILPGMVTETKTIRHVRWHLDGSRITAEVSFVPYEMADLRGGLDYLRSHRAVVESQETDGTLNLIVDNRFSLTKVPFQAGIPGTIKILPGDVVTVCAWGGDPRQWFAHSLIRTPGSPVARVGDSVDCGTLLVVHTAGLLSLVQLFPNTIVGNVALQAAVVAAGLAGAIAIQVPITGVVSSGSERVSSS